MRLRIYIHLHYVLCMCIEVFVIWFTQSTVSVNRVVSIHMASRLIPEYAPGGTDILTRGLSGLESRVGLGSRDSDCAIARESMSDPAVFMMHVLYA